MKNKETKTKMNVIIILSVIAVFFINFIFIDKIYKIVEYPVDNIYDTNQKIYNNTREVLIYGEEAKSKEICDLLATHNITSETLIDIEKLDKSYPYKYLLAVYNEDLDNLVACSIAAKIMGITKIIALCNNQYNNKIYEENHIYYLSSDASTSEIVLALLSYHNKRGA